MNFSSTSKSVFTVNHSSSQMSTEQMSDIKFIDVDDDEVDDKSCDTRDCVGKSSPKLLDDDTEHSSGMERERVGVFDYFSPSVSISKSSERLLGSKSDSFYLGPRSSSKVGSSGAKKFVQLHRAGEQSTGINDDLSDEDIINANTLPNSSKSWHDHNEHLRQSNSKIYDDFEPAGDTNGNDKEAAKVLADRNVIKPRHSSSAYNLGIRTVDSRVAQADLQQPGDLYKTELLNNIYQVPTFSDSEDTEHDNTVAARSESFTEHDRSSVYRQPKYVSESSAKDAYDPVFHHQRAVTQNCAWEVSAQTGNRDSYGAHVLSSRGASICRSSELVQVTSATSIRCSTGVDTRVGFPLSSASSSTGTSNTYGVSSQVESSRWPNSSTDKNFGGWSSSRNGLQPVMLSEDRDYNQREKSWKDRYDEQESGQQSGGSDDGEPTDHYDSTAEALRKLQDSDRSTGVRSSQVGPSYGSMYCPQYSLMSQDDEEEEMARRRMHGHFERMQRRREVRRSKLQQTTGAYLASEVPGNRGEDSLDELVSYIDASAAAGKDAAGKSRKPNKKKKKAGSKSAAEKAETQLAVSDTHLTDSCQDTMTESMGDVEESSSTLGGADDVGEECCRNGSQLEGVGGELGMQADGGDAIASHVRVSEWNEKHAEIMPSCLQSCNGDTESTMTDVEVRAEFEPEELANCKSEENTLSLNVAASEAVTAESSDTVKAVDSNAVSSVIIAVNVQSEQEGKTESHFSDSENHPKKPSVEAPEQKAVAELMASISDTTSDSGTRDSELFSIESFLAAESDGMSDNGSVQNEQFITVQKKKRVKSNVAAAVEEQQARPPYWSGFKARPFDNREGYQTAGGKSIIDRDGYQHKRPYVKSYEFYSSSTPATTGANVVRTGPSKYASNTYQKTDGYKMRETYNHRINDVDSRGVTVAADAKSVSLPYSVSTSTSDPTPASEKFQGSVCSRLDVFAENTAGKCVKNPRFATEFNITCADDTVDTLAPSRTGNKSSVNNNDDSSGLSNAAAPRRAPYKVYSSLAGEKTSDIVRQPADSQLASSATASRLEESPSISVRRSSVTLDSATVPQDVTSRAETPDSFHSSRPQSPRQAGSRSTVFLDTRKIAETTPPRTDISFGFDPSTSPPDVSEFVTSQPQPCAVQASASACHCSMVNPIVQPGCTPVYYVYHPAIQTLAYQPLVAPYGRCTPIGVVPPMPVMATVPVESVMPSADKISYTVPEIKSVQPDVNLVTSPVVSMSASAASAATAAAPENTSKSAFDSYAAQCFLFKEFESVLECDNNSLPGQCLVIRFSDLEKNEDQ